MVSYISRWLWLCWYCTSSEDDTEHNLQPGVELGSSSPFQKRRALAEQSASHKGCFAVLKGLRYQKPVWFRVEVACRRDPSRKLLFVLCR